MKYIKIAIGAVIAISVIPMIMTSIDKLTNPTTGTIKGTVTATLLDLAPLVFVAGVLGFLFLKTGSNKGE